MELFEYIKKSYKTPNPFVVKSLGGSEELVEYLRETPWNTNLNVVNAYCGGTDTIIITFTTFLDFYDCDTDEKLSSPYEMTVPKNSLVKVPTFKNTYTHWEDEGGATYEGCEEYVFSKDTALVDGGR